MASKIIVLGEVNGNLQPIFKKLSTLHAKNNFAFAIVSGNLFSDDNDALSSLLGGQITIPLPTYFTVGTNALPSKIVERIEKDEEICPNLHYLGKRSTMKTSEGIRIVALGGNLDESIIGLSKEQQLPYHTVGDAKAIQGTHNADILLTSTWPSSIRTGSKVPAPEGLTDITGQDHIADLCAALKPRYHFSSSPEFYFEREPFFHFSPENPDEKPVTRFISMAAHGNPSKEKAFYAFSLQTNIDPTAPVPANATRSPLVRANPKKRQALGSDPYSRDGGYDDHPHYNKRGRARRGERLPPPGPQQCFFCISNPDTAIHLIASIGEEAYLTIAKGPLTTSETNAAQGLDFPTHALIIPLTHSSTLSSISDENDSKQKTFAEMTKFKESLQTMIAKRSGNKFGTVTYEISKGNGVHFQWQLIPMAIETIQKNLVEAAFRVESENRLYPAFEVRDPGIGVNEGDFFRVWIWTPPTEVNPEGSSKCLVMPFDRSIRFDLQFGRVVLAKLLGLEKRVQWRDCVQTMEEEKKDIALFKAAFKEYDFTD